ncbi:hypothetical protein HYDPIDRAFT_92430 [Hydnomerulius pinastri MD-312]|uniref:DUF6697 domain-containing protein n=1 Tax=Hydnomerulius pinastri MD-312 TaxID=994086 RepID=A0A0C9VCM0_9AGAM|nr:hypothetical protein HYDPIDRAFT_92430 [Hydnomerulius pinastri MD-312]
MVDIALAVQLERLRVAEALTARDNIVMHLEDAYTSVRQKAATILQLEQELQVFKRASTPATTNSTSFLEAREIPATPLVDEEDRKRNVDHSSDHEIHVTDKTIAARQALLAALPLPSYIPDDVLQPIVIPSPYTLHEFLGNISGSLKDSLTNYRVLGQPTTYWCPEREEHGYFLTPVFKCNTNPRVATAHRWSVVDVIGNMSKTTDCFYNKDGKWYYAGTYQAFRMEDLTTQEWEVLSNETTQAVIKETLAGRKNVSPQNHYETGQLYGAGALRVACIGLQCVGFNEDVYRGVLEQSRFASWGRGSGWTTAGASTARGDTTVEDTKPFAA